MLTRIISGGQTGVDRAALDAALERGLPIGGWCPKGRLAEDGVVPAHYPLTELPTPSYPARTKRNVLSANGTLVITVGHPSGGTLATVSECRFAKRPCRIVDLNELEWHGEYGSQIAGAANWIRHVILDPLLGSILNVAGPRESKCPGIYGRARVFMLDVLAQLDRLKAGRTSDGQA